MKKMILAFLVISFNTSINAQNVGIGTTSPQSDLHLHSPATSSSTFRLSNNITTDASNRGANLRMLGGNLFINNEELTGSIGIVTNGIDRMTFLSNGNVGIGTTSPLSKLHITQTGQTARGLNVSVSPGFNNTSGIFVGNPNNFSFPNNYAYGIHSVSGNGSIFFSPTINYGVIGECQNTSAGIGVMGISNSPSPDINQAAVIGFNFSPAASAYGIIGASTGSSGAGTVGLTHNATAGLLGLAYFNSTGPAIKSVSYSSSSQIGLELENGAIKVSGAKRTVFQITANTGFGGNTSGNTLTIPNTTLANAATDLLIVTPVYVSVYLNKPIGVWWDGASSTWNIFTQDQSNMPNGAIFNVMVVKQ